MKPKDLVVGKKYYYNFNKTKCQMVFKEKGKIPGTNHVAYYFRVKGEASGDLLFLRPCEIELVVTEFIKEDKSRTS